MSHDLEPHADDDSDGPFVYGGWYNANNPGWAPHWFKPGHFEVELVRQYTDWEDNPVAEVVREGERFEAGQTYCWSTYLREHDGCTRCIGDFATYGEAHCYGEKIAAEIAGTYRAVGTRSIDPAIAKYVDSEGFGGYIEAVYDPLRHDGNLEGPYAVWEDGDGNVEHVTDDPSDFDNADHFSIFIHCRAGGTETVGDFRTQAEAEGYRDVYAANFLRGLGVTPGRTQ